MGFNMSLLRHKEAYVSKPICSLTPEIRIKNLLYVQCQDLGLWTVTKINIIPGFTELNSNLIFIMILF